MAGIGTCVWNPTTQQMNPTEEVAASTQSLHLHPTAKENCLDSIWDYPLAQLLTHYPHVQSEQVMMQSCLPSYTVRILSV